MLLLIFPFSQFEHTVTTVLLRPWVCIHNQQKQQQESDNACRTYFSYSLHAVPWNALFEKQNNVFSTKICKNMGEGVLHSKWPKFGKISGKYLLLSHFTDFLAIFFGYNPGMPLFFRIVILENKVMCGL